jgi:hypothetical protein
MLFLKRSIRNGAEEDAVVLATGEVRRANANLIRNSLSSHHQSELHRGFRSRTCDAVTFGIESKIKLASRILLAASSLCCVPQVSGATAAELRNPIYATPVDGQCQAPR